MLTNVIQAYNLEFLPENDSYQKQLSLINLQGHTTLDKATWN